MAGAGCVQSVQSFLFPVDVSRSVSDLHTVICGSTNGPGLTNTALKASRHPGPSFDTRAANPHVGPARVRLMRGK